MKNKIVSLSCKSFIFLFLIVFGTQSCLSPRDRSIKNWERYEWKTIKVDKNTNPSTWMTYARNVKGSKYKEYKIVGKINASPAQAIQVLSEDKLRANKYLDGKLISSVVEKTGLQKFTLTEVWTENPSSLEGKDHVKEIRGVWEFVPIGSKQSNLTYIIFADPRGSMPLSAFLKEVKTRLNK